MSIHNINNLQNPVDFAYIKSYTDEYLIQSLANAGQRLGIKGDSIGFNHFKFAEIFDNATNGDVSKYDNKKYIGYITYNQKEGKTFYGFIPNGKKYNNRINGHHVVGDNIFDIFYMDSFKFDYSVNNIEKYISSNNILVYSADNKFYDLLYGKLLNKSDDEKNNIEIIFDKFNENTGLLELSVRAYHLYSDGISNIYCLLKLSLEDNNATNDDNTKYKLEVYKFDSALLSSEISKEQFENCFNLSAHLKNQNNQYLFNSINFTSLFDDGELTEDELFMYKSESQCTLFGLMINHELNNEINLIENNKIELLYDNDKNQHLSLNLDPNSTSSFNVINDLLSKGNSSDIYTRIYFFNNDIIYNHNNLLEEYSNRNFSLNKCTLFKRILFKIYQYLYNSVKSSSDIDVDYVLYIPTDYKFNYLYNKNEPLELYHSEDIFVSNIDLENTYKNELNEFDVLQTTSNNLIFDYEGCIEEYIQNINFNINYSKLSIDKIIGITVSKVYTLPYINKENQWVINNSNTSIKAIGKDAGNPNLIILYNYKENDNLVSKIICSAASINKTFLNYIKYNNTSISIDPFRLGIEGSTNISCNVSIPIISENTKGLFENSLIILLSRTEDCINNKDVLKDLSTLPNYISSLWYVDVNNILNNYPQFSCITREETIGGNYPLDLGDLLNIDNIIDVYSKKYSEDSEPKFSKIILKSQTKNLGNNIKSLINNIINVEDVNYYKKAYYIPFKENIEIDKKLELIDYKNSCNLNIKYENSDDNFTYFLNDINGLDSNSISNIPYPIIEYNDNDDVNIKNNNSDKIYKWVMTEKAKTDQTLNQNISYYGVTEQNVIIKTTYKGLERISEISASNTYENIEFSAIGTREYGLSVSYSESNPTINDIKYHNEYVFNMDVPTLDLQEVFVTNSTSLNRLNLLSIGKDGSNVLLYNSYIGTTFDDNEKSTLHIGSSSRNINIGNTKLLNYSETNKFLKQDKVSIDFENIILNGDVEAKNNLIITNKTTTKEFESSLNIKNYGNSYYGFEYSGMASMVQIVNNAIDVNMKSGLSSYVLFNNHDFNMVHIQDESINQDMYICEYITNISSDDTGRLSSINVNILKEKDIYIYDNSYYITDANKCGDSEKINNSYYTSFINLNNIVRNYMNSIYPDLKNGIDDLGNKLVIRHYINGEIYMSINSSDIYDLSNKAIIEGSSLEYSKYYMEFGLDKEDNITSNNNEIDKKYFIFELPKGHQKDVYLNCNLDNIIGINKNTEKIHNIIPNRLFTLKEPIRFLTYKFIDNTENKIENKEKICLEVYTSGNINYQAFRNVK